MRRRDFIAGIGGLLTPPLVARAQQPALPVIGYLTEGPETPTSGFGGSEDPFYASVRRGLAEQGFSEGRNLEILYRLTLQYDGLPMLAEELVRRQVNAIFAGGSPAAQVAKFATAMIPIVFAVGGDPIGSGLVASLNRPGGNVTGVTYRGTELVTKRIELLHEIVPTVDSIGFLINQTNAQLEADTREAQLAARVLGLNLVMLNASTASEIEAAFAVIAARRVGALLVAGDPLYSVQTHQLVALAARHTVPAMYYVRDPVETGGLMSYGPSFDEVWRIAGTYVGRILKGEKPSDLPVQQSTRFEMVLNLKTAKALGIDVPTATLLRATEVIE